ncbi:MAG TPA: sialate O-acetylesterase [Gemmataceae bacterium]|jgi:sialate O-acetylesterase|nr:sialate O-acetylesterase [Gemmataceae bacterium]
MHSRSSLLIAALMAFATSPAARADVKPHPLFSDHMVLQRDVPIPVWGTAEPGEQVGVSIKGSGQSSASPSVSANADGTWKVQLSKLPAGGPYELTIKGKNTVTIKDVLIGEVWICSGQSNMEWQLRNSFESAKAIEAANHPMLRLFTVRKTAAGSPQTTVPVNTDQRVGQWQECTSETVPGFSAVAYYFGRDLQKALGVPVGLIHTSWGGTPAQAWTSKEALNAVTDLKYYPEKAQPQYEYDVARYEFGQAQHKMNVAKAKLDGQPEPKAPPQLRVRPQPPDRNPNAPSSLYNAMIAPLLNYPIKGAIWYQGESNAGKAHEYRTLFATMIKDWRDRWHLGDFPFLCVQLAPFDRVQGNTWPELREAQLLATQTLPNVGMAVITDVGERADIHPKKKEPVGARLALLARKIAYGEKITAMGPVYKSMKTEGNRAVLSFDNVGIGLEARDGKLTGFEIAGADKQFHPAEAEIRGETVVVYSDKVESPVAVRYGWQNYPQVNLWNKDGLPATPFRTDDWPGITWPKTTAAVQR